MAELIYISSNKPSMSEIPIISGQIINAVDVGETYYDSDNGIRMRFDNVIYLYSEDDRILYESPKEHILYVVTSTSKLYKYKLSTGWIKMVTTSDMYDIIDIVEELTPGTIFRDGSKIAPRTLANYVYTSQGERVEDKLKTISKLGVVTNYLLIENDNQMEFDIPIPFDNYFELGNYVEIFIGSTLVDERRYVIENNKLKLLVSDKQFVKGRDITFKFLYNAATPPVGVTIAIDGDYIVDRSISTKKLAGVYDGVDIANPQMIPSMLALSTAYDNLNSKVNAIAGNLVAHAISTGDNGRDLQASIPNFVLTDNSTIYLKLHTDVEAGATLSINGGQSYPIYLNYKEPIKRGLLKDDVLNITYSALYHKYFTNASVAYRLQHYKYEYIAKGGENTITINISEYEPNFDELKVYQNSIRLLENTHYKIVDRKIVLIGYIAESNDLFLFELDKVKGNGLPLDGNTIMKELVFSEKVFFKNGVDITGDLDIKGNINLDGSFNFSGGAASESAFTAEQFISTAKAPLPPIVCKSTALVENLNADMVDGYHATDLVMPDDSIEFIIDGETDILDPTLQITFNSFYGRIDALTDRMIVSDNPDRATADKRNLLDSIPEVEIDPSDPMFNSVVQDTVEDIVWKLDNLRYMMLATLEPIYDVNDLNSMSGDEMKEYEHINPTYLTFFNNITEMIKAIDDDLFLIEEEMLIGADEDYVPPSTFTELRSLLRTINETPIEKTYDEVPTVFELSNGLTQKTATRAKYMLNEGKRIYPITHKNAIIGLPNAELATIRNIESLTKIIDELKARIETLEALTGGGIEGKAFTYVTTV